MEKNQNFKGLKNLKTDLKYCTTIVGENGTIKTSLLEAKSKSNL